MKPAVAAAAYRSGEKITNEWDGMIHDYTRKRGIVHSEILLPPNAPPDFQDRGTLWNSVEQIEKACNSQLARELEGALPIELSREEQVRIVRAYCSSQFVSRGMCADFNIHDTGSGNPHAHILLTMRPMDERGKWLPKSRKEYVLDESGERIRLSSGRYKTRKVDLVDWNSQENAEVWRKVWADLSGKARENMETVKRSSNNVIEFLQSEGYIRFKADSEASSKALYEAYQRWCEDNAQKPMSANRLSSELAQNERLYNVEATNNVHVGGKRVRGFMGIEVVNPLPY